MDTNRIAIVNRDESIVASTESTGSTGYMVARAPKGPIKPVFIPAGQIQRFHEYIGYPHGDFESLQEAIDFNQEFGLFVSAPYNVAGANRLPVSYATPAGVFNRRQTVDLTGVKIEDIEEVGADIPNITSFSTVQNVLLPAGRTNSIFGREEADVANPLTYDIDTGTGERSIRLSIGFDILEAINNQAATRSLFLSNGAFDANTGRYFRKPQDSVSVDGYLVIDIPGEDRIRLRIVRNVTAIELRSDVGGHLIASITGAPTVNTLIINNVDQFERGSLAGAALKYLSLNAITNTWASDSFRESVKFYFEAEVDHNAIFATFYQKYLSQRETVLSFPSQPLGNRIRFSVTEAITNTQSVSKSTEISLDPGDVDGFGASLDITTKLADQGIISIYTIKQFSTDTVYTATRNTSAPTWTGDSIPHRRGVRITSNEALEQGWVEAANNEYEAVEVFFESRDIGDVESSTFLSLGNTHKLSRFVGTRLVPPNQAATVPQLTYGQNYFIVTNHFSRRNPYTREFIMSPLVGAYSRMIARIIDQRFGGAAPMFLNRGNLGGQLGVQVRKALYSYNADQQTALDRANYNPIILHPSYGVMVTSQKTARAGELSDWSYIGHASAFLKFQRDVRDFVMIDQIGKPNNPQFRVQRRDQVSSLLRPRLEGDRIWAEAVVDTTTANSSPEVQNQRRFIIDVKVKVDIFSEFVTLVFTNVDQNTQLGA